MQNNIGHVNAVAASTADELAKVLAQLGAGQYQYQQAS